MRSPAGRPSVVSSPRPGARLLLRGAGFGLPAAILFARSFFTTVGDLLHDDRMQSRRFVNGRVRQAHVPGQVDVGQLALKPGSRRNAFAEAVLLVEIHEVENVFRNRLRVGCIESHYQLDGNVLPVERVGDINVALAPSEWPMTTTMS